MMNTEGVNVDMLKFEIDTYAESQNFSRIKGRNSEHMLYRRNHPHVDATVSFNIEQAEHARLRGLTEFNRWLEKAFDK